MSSKDFNDVTHPGSVPGEPSVIAEDSAEEEFPSEATRIDPAFLAPQAPTRPKAKASSGSLEALAASRAQARQEAPPPRERAAPSAARNPKLAALQSLSLDGGSSTRLPPSPRQQGGSKLPWAILACIGLAFGGKYAYDKYYHPETPKPDQPLVRTETVQASGGSGQTYVAAGFIAARDPISIGAPTGGLVKEVRVHENDHVVRGQLVVEMDSSAAAAELSAIHAEVHELQRAADQMEMLYKAGAATVVQLGQAKGAVAVARAKTSGPDQKIAMARVHTLSSGTVLEVIVHPGETVAPNGTLIKIADLHNLIVQVDVNQADLVKVRPGQQVEVVAEAFPGKTFKGVVGLVGKEVDKAKGTFSVRVDLQAVEEALKSGMNVKCTFQPLQGELPRIFVSRSAVTPQSTVFVVGADRIVKQRPVKIGEAQGLSTEIVSGLTAGEQIVSDAQSVRDGQLLSQ